VKVKGEKEGFSRCPRYLDTFLHQKEHEKKGEKGTLGGAPGKRPKIREAVTTRSG